MFWRMCVCVFMDAVVSRELIQHVNHVLQSTAFSRLVHKCKRRGTFFCFVSNLFSVSHTHTPSPLWPSVLLFARSFPQTGVWCEYLYCVLLLCNSCGCFRLTCCLFWIKSTEKDDDYIVLCHHWDCWVLLSLQLLLIKGFTQVKHLHQPLTLRPLYLHSKLMCCLCVLFAGKRLSPRKRISWAALTYFYPIIWIF